METNGFLINTKWQKTIIGYTNLYELEQLIKDQKKPILENDKKIIKKLIQEKLPVKYKKYKSVFLKAVSNTLPPYRERVDHNIIFEEDNTLSPNLLYNISLDQLKMVKDYLKNHLNKGFIIYNNTSYASPVLFAKKP